WRLADPGRGRHLVQKRDAPRQARKCDESCASSLPVWSESATRPPFSTILNREVNARSRGRPVQSSPPAEPRLHRLLSAGWFLVFPPPVSLARGARVPRAAHPGVPATPLFAC